MFEIPTRLQNKVCSAVDAAALIKDGSIIAASGYTSAGDPKATLFELAKRGFAGELHEITLLTAAQLSQRIEDQLALSGIVKKRVPFTTSKVVRDLTNAQKLQYVEVPLSRVPQLFASGAFGIPDIAVIEALSISADGQLTLTSSVGMTQLLCDYSKHLIIEINTAQPKELAGLHDICEEKGALNTVNQRVGKMTAKIDLNKVQAVVFTSIPDERPNILLPTKQEERIAEFLQEFLEKEYPKGILPPIQTGIGGMSRVVLRSFLNSEFQNIDFFCGALQDETLELLLAGKARYLSGGSITTTQAFQNVAAALGSDFKNYVVLRSMTQTNGASAAERLGIIAINTGMEMDLFGNTNTSHARGNRVVNGVGGVTAFTSSSALSIMLLPSVKKDGSISSFVPMIPHVDIIHHHVDVVISENGIADLRGIDDIRAAKEILGNCVHPAYYDALSAELDLMLKTGGHHPVYLPSAFSWHLNAASTGTMMLK